MINLIVFVIALFLLLIFGKILLLPLKIIFELIINGVVGGIVLLLSNALIGSSGYYIDVNPLSTLIVGIFGVPGYIVLLLLRIL